ncbi:MAG: DJ-1/PfpI family protein [Eubacteriales bacterium]|nr:DJ-1/PfpI family protein [Eubacteriales bacterium]
MFYCLLAPGFEEIEAIATVDMLRRGGVEVQTVGIGCGCTPKIEGGHNITVTADIKESGIVTDGLEGIILPGGMPGTLNLEKSKTVKKLIDYCVFNNLYICAICAAPQILGHMGLLSGKRATCYPGFEDELIGAQIVNAPAVVDGKIITGKGPGCTVEFASAIIEAVADKETAQKIKDSMQCQ